MVLGEKTDPVSRVLRGVQGNETDVTCAHSRALPYPQSRQSQLRDAELPLGSPRICSLGRDGKGESGESGGRGVLPMQSRGGPPH